MSSQGQSDNLRNLAPRTIGYACAYGYWNSPDDLGARQHLSPSQLYARIAEQWDAAARAAVVMFLADMEKKGLKLVPRESTWDAAPEVDVEALLKDKP
jgi:hypothetical protein